jgi:hypothetical protein
LPLATSPTTAVAVGFHVEAVYILFHIVPQFPTPGIVSVDPNAGDLAASASDIVLILEVALESGDVPDVSAVTNTPDFHNPNPSTIKQIRPNNKPFAFQFFHYPLIDILL